MKYFTKIAFLLPFILSPCLLIAQFTRQDTLRGSIGSGREWWDVKHYDLTINVDISNKSINGSNRLKFSVLKGGSGKIMQVDLQPPMEIQKVEDAGDNNRVLSFKREGNVYWIDFGSRSFTTTKDTKADQSIIIYFSGKPREAVRAPWDGGWVWQKDEKGRPWVTVACQGLGASAWYPCKDHQSDEPDDGARLSIEIPDTLVAVAAGASLAPVIKNGMARYSYQVVNPINNYNIVPYIGKYVNWSESFTGLKGALELSYWVLDYNLEKANKQFGRDVKPMFRCFEDWFGPYPFYEDQFKLVETPHLGMEHQSAIAYGNKFMNGYLGTDLSGTGWGTKWDYIIIHEAGHEWFANNITTNDIADMWVHEGFTTYSEVLFVECQSGKQAANEYCRGLRQNIQNDSPLIGTYGVNKEGSGDMYPKGANLLHTIRQVIDNDQQFKKILRGLNKSFYHKTINSADVEKYISKESGKKLEKIFDQYLRTNQIPLLEYRFEGSTFSYRWANCIAGFNMPLKVYYEKKANWITPGSEWQSKSMPAGFDPQNFSIDPNFYIQAEKKSGQVRR